MMKFFLQPSARAVIVVAVLLLTSSSCHGFSAIRSSVFHGSRVSVVEPLRRPSSPRTNVREDMSMRKQKASDKRTRRRQQQSVEEAPSFPVTLTASPMRGKEWRLRQQQQGSNFVTPVSTTTVATGGGRQRSRKRNTLYNSLSFYHNTFVNQLTFEYQAEEEEVMGRIKASIEDPLGLEVAGHALFDMYAERRGNLFSDEVYRLTKAPDATTSYPRDEEDDAPRSVRYLPPNHKFSNNDVILLTLQPDGSGDFFSTTTLPTHEAALSIEARVLNVGPTYVDIAVSPGTFVGSFGPPPNDKTSTNAAPNHNLRLRADRFFSNVPYQRMVAALAVFSRLPDHRPSSSKNNKQQQSEKDKVPDIHMDEVLRETILQTFSLQNHNSPLLRDPDLGHVHDLANRLSKPPMATSSKLASQALKYIRSNSQGIFREFNAPQRAAIEAALTRRMTMIHGPPGSGKTTVASAIAFGFAHQCRSLPPGAKVLACAFSNVGADNLAEAIRKLGLNVVRVGKASAVSQSLWDCTLDAAIDRDPDAQKALQRAAKATADLKQLRQRKSKGTSASAASERFLQESATAAVKESIKVSNIAATRAMREADVIVSTSTGAADPRLLAACGIVTGEDVSSPETKSSTGESASRENAPDGLPPLSLPFVLVDEACQSVEPATLVPIVSTNSCRALVMLGDPCQLPATIRSRKSSGLSVSLMERLAAELPHPSVSTVGDQGTLKDTAYLETKPIKQAKSLLRAREARETHRGHEASYRKRYGGSMLLSIQYRMHPSIAAFPSAIFYNGLLSTPKFMAAQRHFPRVLTPTLPCADPNMCVRAIDVGGRSNERQGMPSRFTRTVFGSTHKASSLEDQTTYWNEPEAEQVVSLIRDIVSDPTRQVGSLGVVTPYNGQVQLIKSMIAGDAKLRDLLMKNPVAIEVKSVDGYQGRERDVIIFSAVRSNRDGRIGFLHDWRRMNVALTRARAGLVVVGDLDTLAEADMHWDAFQKWASGVRCIIDAGNDCLEDEPSF